jgi:hypothetical protein
MSEWQTIGSLMAGKAPGSVELVNDLGTRFTPYFKDSDGDWNGLREGGSDYFVPDPAIWQVYTPPPAPIPVCTCTKGIVTNGYLQMTDDEAEAFSKEIERVRGLKPTEPTEKPQLWWVKYAGGHWILSPGAYSTKEEVMRSHYKCDEARPSGIFAPSDNLIYAPEEEKV